ncbi:Auxin transporter-like protein 3 [Hibiscus syriacus]|uniref:Auxin transporter-like protein 3 n=1 Tax=Hibiscus syriacus TaxID=106335 RepID=A0A6A2XMY1_HIBSY|nr:Auxin transporter-like protein 3 [Hibiscus syriacus]
MGSEKVGETVIVGSYVEMKPEGKSNGMKSKFSKLFWHGGGSSVAYIALLVFSARNAFRDSPSALLWIVGSWTAYIISILYWFEVLDGLLGKHWRNVGLAFNCTFLLFGSVIQLIACASNIYYIMTIWTRGHGLTSLGHVVPPLSLFLHFTITESGLSWPPDDHLHCLVSHRCLTPPWPGNNKKRLIFSGQIHAKEIMHAMWKPQKFKAIYMMATVYVTTLTLPSAAAVYWAFGDMLLDHSNAFSLLPRSPFRDMAFITFGFACTPLYFVWEKAIGMHECKSLCKRAAARLPVVIPIWFLAIIFPFFGPINSTVGSLLVSFTVYIIPALAHIFTFRSAAARENAVDQPPKYFGRWVGTFTINAFIVVWVLIVGFGFGGWASMINFIDQIDTFGFFTKCYQCPAPAPAWQRLHHHRLAASMPHRLLLYTTTHSTTLVTPDLRHGRIEYIVCHGCTFV